MKKALLIGTASLLFLAGLGWCAVRLYRQAAMEAAANAPLRPAFVCRSEGPWSVIQLEATQQLLPAPRWMRPLPGGYLVAQVAWSGVQWIALFKGGTLQELLTIPCPTGVEPKAFESATLLDAQLSAGKALVLLYAPASRKQAPITLTWDLSTKALRWFHRGAGRRLAMAPGPDPSGVFLYQGDRALCFLPLNASGGAVQGIKIELPPEIPNISELLPLSGSTFLAAHIRGLSARMEDGSWIHHNLPAKGPLDFPESMSALARTSEGLWWQPWPGSLQKVQSGGRAFEAMDRGTFINPDRFIRDSKLLHLIGSDTQDRIWFGIAMPSFRSEASRPVVDTKADEQEGWKSEEAAPALVSPTTESKSEWEEYLKAPLDRLYVWDPRTSRLALVDFTEEWSKLNPPTGIGQPHGFASAAPEGGGLLLAGDRLVAFLPLGALGK